LSDTSAMARTAKSRLWLRIGCWTFVATALLHLIGHFQALAGSSDLLVGFSWSFSALCLFAGLAGLAVARQGGVRLVRTVAVLYSLLAGAMLVISIRFFALPPVVSFGIVLLSCGIAAVAGRPGDDADPIRAPG